MLERLRQLEDLPEEEKEEQLKAYNDALDQRMNEYITRELDDPSKDVEGGKVEWNNNHYEIHKETRGINTDIQEVMKDFSDDVEQMRKDFSIDALIRLKKS